MKRLRPLLFLSIVFLTAHSASAEVIEVTFTLTPATADENTLNLGLSIAVPFVGAVPSSDSSQASGTVLARLDLDPESGAVSSFALLSGDISASDVNFVGSLFGSELYNLQAQDMGATVVTPSPPAAVSQGLSPAELHDITINEGTLSGRSALGPIEPQDFAELPVTGSGGEGDFVEITAVRSSRSSTSRDVFDLMLRYPISISQMIDTEGGSGTITATGTVRALAEASLRRLAPNPYLAWAVANGNAEAPFEQKNFSSTLPNGLFWALGYEAGEAASSLVPAGAGSFSLTLPARGSASDVAVEFSSDLSAPNSWEEIDTIPAGSTGLQGPFGGSGRAGFLRLAVNEPAQ